MTIPTPQLLLAGDIGGTHTRLALFVLADGNDVPKQLAHVDLDSVGLAARGTLEDAVVTFLGHAGRGMPDAMVLACAGPVRDGESQVTNLPWVISEAGLRKTTGSARVRLVNDFEAMAHGTLTLAASEREVLQDGLRDATGACLVIGAGTGLGQAWVVPSTLPAGGAGLPRVFASEGGHQSFAPRDELEDGLLAWLRGRYGRVSVERVVSGLGLVDLYTYLDETGAALTSDAMRKAVAEQGAAAVGLYGASPQGDAVCQLAVRRFVSLYGAHAGDAALGLLPTGGVVVAGGIALALLPTMREVFMPAFLDKGRLSPALTPLHVEVALAPDTGLRGATRLAQGLAAGML